MAAVNTDTAAQASGTGLRIWIDADATYAFGRATNDDNPHYADGTAVPLLYTGALVLPARNRRSSAGVVAPRRPVIEGGSMSVHGEHDVYLHGPVAPDSELFLTSGLYGAWQRANGVLITERHAFADVAGTVLVEHLWSDFFPRGRFAADVPGDVGEPKPDHAFPETARARHVSTRSVHVDRDQTYRYAGVSGDHVPHAMDADAARREGYDGKILQGMCTFAIVSGALVVEVGGGDPNRVRRVAGRFAAPARPGLALEVDIYDIGDAHDGGHEFAYEAVQDGVAVVRHGRVEIHPD